MVGSRSRLLSTQISEVVGVQIEGRLIHLNWVEHLEKSWNYNQPHWVNCASK